MQPFTRFLDLVYTIQYKLLGVKTVGSRRYLIFRKLLKMMMNVFFFYKFKFVISVCLGVKEFVFPFSVIGNESILTRLFFEWVLNRF